MNGANMDDVKAGKQNTETTGSVTEKTQDGEDSAVMNATTKEQVSSTVDVKTSVPPAPIDSRADAEDGYKGRIKLMRDTKERQNKDEGKQREDEDKEKDVTDAHASDGKKNGDNGGGGGKATGGKKVSGTADSDLDPEAEAAIASELQDALSQNWQAPDGGWGWVVVISAMVVSLIVDGLTYTFGLFLGPFEKVFKAPKSTIALASSLQVGIYLVMGPIVSALTNRFGCRPVIIVGSLVAGLAYIVSAWSPDVTTLILTYGVVGGIGFGMMYLPSIVAVSVYFEERRAIATGIAVCGSGIGTFILAPLTDVLLYEYNWSWTLLILGGIVLNGMVFGALVRPLDLPEPDDTEDDEGEDEEEQEEDAVSKRSGISKRSARDEEEGGFLKNARRRRKKISTSSSGHEIVPMITVTDEEHNTTVMYNDATQAIKPDTSPNLFFSSAPNMIINSTSQLSKAVAKKSHKSSRKSSVNSSEHAPPRIRANTLEFHRLHRAQSTSDRSYSSAGSRVRSHAPLGLAFISLSDAHLNRIRDDIHLPLSRRDIHLSGTLAYPEWDQRGHRAGRNRGLYIQSIRSIASLNVKDGADGISKPRGLWACLPESARETLEEMLDLSILKDKSYWFVLLGNFFCMIGFYVPFVYVAERAKEIGIGEENAAFLISIIGITNTVGRVMTGVVMNFFDIDCVLVTSVALFLAGVVTAVCPLFETYVALAAASAIFGICVAAYISLCSVLLCELLGVENLTNAFGFVILFRGVACIMGPPIAGAIIDATGVFNPAFYVGGGMIVLGAISHAMLLSPCSHRNKIDS